jgi:hypothetical protein
MVHPPSDQYTKLLQCPKSASSSIEDADMLLDVVILDVVGGLYGKGDPMRQETDINVIGEHIHR